jgi:hypothetical protein
MAAIAAGLKPRISVSLAFYQLFIRFSEGHHLLKAMRQSSPPHGESAREERNCLTQLKMTASQDVV